MHGGIGTGHFAQGLPTLEMLLNGLSKNFEMVIYSHRSPNAGYQSHYSTIRTAPGYVTTNIFRWAYLIGYFIQDHFKKRFQIIFSFWGYPAGFIAVGLGKLFSIRSIVYLLGADAVGIPSIRYGILINSFHRTLAFWAYRRAACLLALSTFQKDQLKNYGFEYPMKIIPWGTDLSLFKFRPQPKGSPLHIIHVGHHALVKDQVTLLKAFSLIIRHQPAILRIFGGDDLDGSLQRKAAELQIDQHTEFVGMVPYHEMPHHYEWAHVMLHTSLSEGQCGALTEAAASGVLMAGTNVGLLYDLGDACAIRVDVRNFEALANKVLAVTNDTETWDKKIFNARRWSEEHDLTWTIRTLTELIFTLQKRE